MPSSPVPQEVQDEITRVVARWHQLPRDHAFVHLPRLTAMIQDLADEIARSRGEPVAAVPNLGPDVAIDQLVVLAYDWTVLVDRGAAGGEDLPASLTDRLRQLRRLLARPVTS